MTHFKQMFTKPLKVRTLDDSVLGILIFCWGGGAAWMNKKNTTKTENSDMVVQFFGHNYKTNSNIKNRINSLISTISSEVNYIKMSFDLLDLDPQRFAH